MYLYKTLGPLSSHVQPHFFVYAISAKLDKIQKELKDETSWRRTLLLVTRKIKSPITRNLRGETAWRVGRVNAGPFISKPVVACSTIAPSRALVAAAFNISPP